VQRKLREIGRGEKANRRRARVGCRRIEIDGQMNISSEEENGIVKKRNFLTVAEEKG